MTGFVLDTSVLSAFAPGRHPVEEAVVEWFRRHESNLHLSTVRIAEIVQGVAKLRRQGAHGRAQAYDEWLDGLVDTMGRRVLDVSVAVARAAGLMSDAARAVGRHPGFPDVAIAATAQVGAMTVLTRNLRQFEPLGVPAADPFSQLP